MNMITDTVMNRHFIQKTIIILAVRLDRPHYGWIVAGGDFVTFTPVLPYTALVNSFILLQELQTFLSNVNGKF